MEIERAREEGESETDRKKDTERERDERDV